MNYKLKNAINEYFATHRIYQYEMERQMNLPATSLSAIIYGRKIPSQKQMENIAKILECSVDTIFPLAEPQKIPAK